PAGRSENGRCPLLPTNPVPRLTPGRAPTRELGGPHGGGPHGTPLRLGTRSRHGRRAPRGARLHSGRQQPIPGSVPSLGARVLEVRIPLPPAGSPLQTRLDSLTRIAPTALLSSRIPLFRPWRIDFKTYIWSAVVAHNLVRLARPKPTYPTASAGRFGVARGP